MNVTLTALCSVLTLQYCAKDNYTCISLVNCCVLELSTTTVVESTCHVQVELSLNKLDILIFTNIHKLKLAPCAFYS